MLVPKTLTALLVATAGASLLAGCSQGGPTPPTNPAPAATPAANALTPITTPSDGPRPGGAGCAPAGAGVPTDASSGPAVDVDGDGRADTVWLQPTRSGPFNIGITTASGATFYASYNSASPLPRRVLVANVDGAGTFAAIVSDGRAAGIFVVLGCSLTPARDSKGNPFVVDLAYANTGTGIGCATVAGSSGPGLVALNLPRNLTPASTTITRTAIRLNGYQASNGVSDTIDVSGDPNGPAATAARAITCGDLTMKANGVGQ